MRGPQPREQAAAPRAQAPGGPNRHDPHARSSRCAEIVQFATSPACRSAATASGRSRSRACRIRRRTVRPIRSPACKIRRSTSERSQGRVPNPTQRRSIVRSIRRCVRAGSHRCSAAHASRPPPRAWARPPRRRHPVRRAAAAPIAGPVRSAAACVPIRRGSVRSNQEPRACRIRRRYEACARAARSCNSLISAEGGEPPSVCA